MRAAGVQDTSIYCIDHAECVSENASLHLKSMLHQAVLLQELVRKDEQGRALQATYTELSDVLDATAVIDKALQPITAGDLANLFRRYAEEWRSARDIWPRLFNDVSYLFDRLDINMPPDILDQIDLVSIGDRLQRARKLANLTQEEAAQFLGFARTTIVAIEKGERKVRPSELVTLARAYKTSVSELVRASEDVESFEVQFQDLEQDTKDNDEITESIYELESLCQNYLMLEQKMAAPLSRRYPMEYSITPANVSQSAESIAIEERSRLGVGDGPIHLMRDMLENEVGLRIFYLALPSRFSAMYFYSERLGGCIAVNRKYPEDRRRWSLAHDYGHFLTSRYAPFIMMGKSSVNKVDSERFADDFSMSFLCLHLQ